MENERLFTVSDNFRVLVREINKNTYIAFELNGQTMVINANAWKKLKPLLHTIDEEFVTRFDFTSEKLFPITDEFNVLVSEDAKDIYVNIQLNEQRMKIEAEKWIKFKESFTMVNGEFDKRYLNKLHRTTKRSISWS